MAADHGRGPGVDHRLVGSKALDDGSVHREDGQAVRSISLAGLDRVALVLVGARQDLLGVADSGALGLLDQPGLLHTRSVGQRRGAAV